MAQGIQEQVRILAAIKAEAHLFAVGLEMLGANLVPRSYDPALEQRESGFDSVCVDVALGVDVKFVANRFVASILAKMLCCAAVGSPVIGIENLNIFAQVLADVLFESAALRILGVKEAKIAATLPDADYDLLVVVRPGVSSAVAHLAANESFVHLDLAVQHRAIHFDHRGSDAVTEVPRGLVADAKRALDLTGRHSFLGLAEQQRRHKPLAQWQVRIVENRSGGYSELVVATGAIEKLLFGFEFDRMFLAAQAARTIREAQATQQFAAPLISREFGHYVS